MSWDFRNSEHFGQSSRSRIARDGYDIAQICLNGHIVNQRVSGNPAKNENYRPRCGDRTFTACPKCNVPIKGAAYRTGVFSELQYYCGSCGKAYPWTELALQAATELVSQQVDFTDEDKEKLIQDIQDVVQKKSRTPVAVENIKKFVLKAGPQFGDALKEIFVNIVSETLNKALFPK